MATPQITLYTNHRCPYAHRAHIALQELDIPFEEIIIDLDTPREAWYLEVNPRGLVPSIKFSSDGLKDEILTESAVIAQFLADWYPSKLLPPSSAGVQAALTRARINFFLDTWNTKIASFMFNIFRSTDQAAAEATALDWVKAVEKEIEPLLADADPFFGGSKELTLAEVNVAPFLLRISALSGAGVLPTSVKTGLEKLPNFSKWSKATTAKPSVLSIWNEEDVVAKTRARVEKVRAQNGSK